MKARMLCENYEGFNPHLNFRTSRVIGAAVLVAATLGSTLPAMSTIDNTVTASGTAPDSSTVDANASESVDVQDAAPVLVLTKTVTLADGVTPVPANAPAGTVVFYRFEVENTGNVTVSDVSINEVSFDGVGSLTPIEIGAPVSDGGPLSGDTQDTAAGDGNYETLGPNDTIAFTASYTVQPADIADEGDGDGNLDNVANASGTAPDVGGGTQTVTSGNDNATFDLEDANPLLEVAKYATSFDRGGTVTPLVDVTDPLAPTNTAAPDTANVQVGDIITYTYIVENTGNVPISSITVSDSSNAEDPDPVPGGANLTNTSTNSSDLDASDNFIELLQPGDYVVFTATDTVTQGDIDNLQ